MKITREMLKAKNACVEGYRAFCEAYPEKEYPEGAEYQEVLDNCAENDKDEYALWLIDIFGQTNGARFIDGDLTTDKSIFVCGSLEVTGKIICKKYVRTGHSIKAGYGIEAGRGIKAGCGIEAGRGIKAGHSIKAGYGIKAGRGIKAGCGIEAGYGIEAGNNYGIYAGLNSNINSDYRFVRAKERPANLMCGKFEAVSNDE